VSVPFGSQGHHPAFDPALRAPSHRVCDLTLCCERAAKVFLIFLTEFNFFGLFPLVYVHPHPQYPPMESSPPLLVFKGNMVLVVYYLRSQSDLPVPKRTASLRSGLFLSPNVATFRGFGSLLTEVWLFSFPRSPGEKGRYKVVPLASAIPSTLRPVPFHLVWVVSLCETFSYQAFGLDSTWLQNSGPNLLPQQRPPFFPISEFPGEVGGSRASNAPGS